MTGTDTVEAAPEMATLMIGGIDAAKKARRVGEAILSRTRREFAARGWRDYRRTDIEVLGAEVPVRRRNRSNGVWRLARQGVAHVPE